MGTEAIGQINLILGHDAGILVVDDEVRNPKHSDTYISLDGKIDASYQRPVILKMNPNIWLASMPNTTSARH